MKWRLEQINAFEFMKVVNLSEKHSLEMLKNQIKKFALDQKRVYRFSYVLFTNVLWLTQNKHRKSNIVNFNLNFSGNTLLSKL